MTCAECSNLIKEEDSPLRCKVFTLGFQKFGVPQLESITLDHAKYCEYFDSISEPPEIDPPEIVSPTPEVECSIKESVTIRKEIEISPTANSQNKMKEILFQHLGKSYDIIGIEFRKISEVSDNDTERNQQERISVFIGEKS